VAQLPVRIFHVDGCGGLAFLGHFSTRLAAMIWILALDFILLIFINISFQRNPITEPGLVLFVIALLVGGPACVSLPLLAARPILKSTQSATLHVLELQLARSADTLQKELRDGTAHLITIRDFNDVHRLYRQVGKVLALPLTRSDLIILGVTVFLATLPSVVLIVSSLNFK
jgi:hypothetical protein